MKNIFLIALISITFILTISCDRVDPYDSKKAIVIDTTTTTIPKKKVLIVELTGFFCGNCPPAAILAHQYKDDNKGNVILMSIHSGGYAKFQTKHPIDLVTKDGDALFQLFGGSFNPAAIVNFKKYSDAFVLNYSKSNLDSKISTILKEDADISIKLNLINNNSKITLDAKIKYLNGSSNANDNLVLYAVEDSIVGWQLDDLFPDSPWIEKYVHNSVFRGSVNGVIGETIASGAIAKNTEIIKSFTYITDIAKININKLRFVACVLDKASYEIKQVEEVYVNK